jgi:hypothetical protein
MILNSIGFLGSLVWLLIVGQWKAVGLGLLITVFAPFLLGFAVLPGMIFAAPGAYFANRKNTIGTYFFGFLSALYIFFVIGVWCSGIAYYFLHDAPRNAFWPLLLWSYGVATSPWTYMAQKENSIPAIISAFCAQAAFIVMMTCVLFGMNLIDAFQVLFLVLAIGVLFQMKILSEARKAEMLYSDF